MLLENLKPADVFYYFEQICNIPHGSFNTEALSNYLVDFAKNKNFKYVKDEYGNVIIYRDGINGGENAEPVILQAHIDMVCEKNYETESKFNFEKDPLKLAIMDDFVFAKGTTLGGDDGIGVAFMLALLSEDTIKLPPLECVFTTDEEVGMIGASKLDMSLLNSKRLINLDEETEGVILTSCAGGAKLSAKVPVRFVERTGVKYDLVVCGLKGGHSGIEINKYRGNANLILGRLLHFISQKIYFDLSDISGGLSDNAIPREAKAEILVNQDDVEKFEDIISDFEKIIKNEYKSLEPEVMIYCESEDEETRPVLTKKTKERIVFMLMTLPDGVQKMSPEDESLVQTSSNVGIIRLHKDSFEVIISVRSSVKSQRDALTDKIKYLTETIGGTFNIGNEYPAWEYTEKSPLRDTLIKCFERQYGHKPKVSGVHAGIEAGIFFNGIEGIDIVSIGPDIFDYHTPKEKLSISSCSRTWTLLTNCLAMICDE